MAARPPAEARPFDDPATRPTEDGLAATLGPAFEPFRLLTNLTAAFRAHWGFSKSGGWMLKVHDGSKALLYAIPFAGSFRISMAIRESEREACLADASLEPVHDRLAAARRFTEGCAVQFDVCSEADLAGIEPFLAKLMALRR